VITISHLGYIKRTSVSEYRTQGRGGRGSKGSSTRAEDFVEYMFVASTHNYLLLFTEKGKCYWLKVYQIPEGTKTSKGRAIQNLISLPADDNIKAFINVTDLKDDEYLDNNFIVMCTRKGIIKKTTLKAYSNVRANGINAIGIKDDDSLLEVKLTNGNCNIVIANKGGRAIRFPEDKVRPMGRTASGVRGITLDGGEDEVVGMITTDDANETVLVVSENGYGKRSSIEDYRMTNRGGKGVKTINVTDKTGKLIAIKAVQEGDDLMIINESGVTIRMSVADLRIMGRATQGVKLIRLGEEDRIAAVTKIDEAEVNGDDNGTNDDVVDKTESTETGETDAPKNEDDEKKPSDDSNE
ncbi:MAG: DNA gyrase subunit A, partial [Bacteroidia bacterium]|nr:DNA gyrase subunit A [Bacteroidia bacterium]